MTEKICPHCQGTLEGYRVTPLVPLATGKGDYVWQCRGTCGIFMFNCPLTEIDERLDKIGKSQQGEGQPDGPAAHDPHSPPNGEGQRLMNI